MIWPSEDDYEIKIGKAIEIASVGAYINVCRLQRGLHVGYAEARHIIDVLGEREHISTDYTPDYGWKILSVSEAQEVRQQDGGRG